jgi:hypothetical protein
VEVQCTTLQSSEINADQIAVLIHFHEFDLHLAGFGLNLVYHLLVSEVASKRECALPLLFVKRWDNACLRHHADELASNFFWGQLTIQESVFKCSIPVGVQRAVRHLFFCLFVSCSVDAHVNFRKMQSSLFLRTIVSLSNSFSILFCSCFVYLILTTTQIVNYFFLSCGWALCPWVSKYVGQSQPLFWFEL